MSRSSALASKATGYPIAKIAAKLAIGYHLDELKNTITGTTSAMFEPTLDYVVVKVPRWNFDKFKGADRQLGLQMKSVGEVMAIGRSFQEALQKACQSLEIGRNGLGADGRELKDKDAIMDILSNPSWNGLFHVYDAFKLGLPFNKIHTSSMMDPWFLRQIEELVLLEKDLENETIESISRELLMEAKRRDMQIDRSLTFLTALRARCMKEDMLKESLECTSLLIHVQLSSQQLLLTTTQRLKKRRTKVRLAIERKLSY